MKDNKAPNGEKEGTMEPGQLVLVLDYENGEPREVFVFEELLELKRMRDLEMCLMSTEPCPKISAEVMPFWEIEKAKKLGDMMA